MNSSRKYTMRARADSATATRARILDAAARLMRQRLRMDIRVEDVAADAGVSHMTVLRAFGTKDALLQAAFDRVRDEVLRQRRTAEPGDVHGSISVLFDHYEELGDIVINNLALEGTDPKAREMLQVGRADHRRWVQRQFGPQLGRIGPDERAHVVDALIVACDIYSWKRLRRDLGRSRSRSELTMRRLVEGLLDARPAKSV